jgi:uncharacterized membrane-anchored protein
MRKMLTHAVIAAIACFVTAPAFADGPGDAGPDVAAPPVRAAPTQPNAEPAALQGQSGVIPLGNGELSLNVPDGYVFYPAAEAHAYMQRTNTTAPNGAVFGLLARRGDDVRAPGTWATVISYDAIGYVQPETASGLSDANFEESVRTARSEQSRPFEGFAAQPAFDAAAPNVIWAERVAAPGSQGPDLRYEQKMLGRYGVACLTSIGSADQMPDITAAAAQLRGMLTFPEGRRHSDFQAASDEVSAYSVPGLVTGVAASTALAESAAGDGGGQTAFGGLSGWFPWIALGVVVLAGAGYMLMRRRGGDDDEEETVEA